jgi:hypothetical protein
MMKAMVLILSMLMASSAFAYSQLEGTWFGKDGKRVELVEFNSALTIHTRSYYADGSPSDFFFEFQVPAHRDVEAGEVIEGRLRSIDGYYGCVFDQPAKMSLDFDGRLKVNFPRLVFHREIREVREDRGFGYRKEVDWTRWGWVETVYHFPIERWTVVSNKCVIDDKINTTSILSR